MLTVVKTVDFGIYLGTSEERVLLPKKEVPKEIEIGDPVEVFLYKDSSDRLIATTAEPKITLGELAVLTVKDTGIDADTEKITTNDENSDIAEESEDTASEDDVANEG